jgi:hypothetical protein
MNEDEAERILAQYEQWDSKQARRAFMARMERRLFRRQRQAMKRTLRPTSAIKLKSDLAH